MIESMGLIKRARGFELLDKPVEAAEAYEEAIRTTSVPLDVYVDLVALYFVCTDPNYYAGHQLPLEFVERLYDRALELEAEVLENFGYNSEIRFWIKFIDDVLNGRPFAKDEYKEIANSGVSSVPYLVVHREFPDNEYYQKRAKEAYLMSLGKETARNRYIFSILSKHFGRGNGEILDQELIEKARMYDRLDKPKEAVESYEEAIKMASVPLGVYIDLAALYFVCGDPGYNSWHELSDEFMEKSEVRLLQLEEEVRQKFGYNSEIRFWIKYYGDVLYGQPYTKEEYEEIANSGDSSVPYLAVLREFPDNEYYKERAKEAYLMSQGMETARKRYVGNILEHNFWEGNRETINTDLLKRARMYDQSNKLKEAAEGYEEAIRTTDVPLDVYVDLVALYFVCRDHDFYSWPGVPLDFEEYLYNRMYELAAEVEKKFGYNSEIDFWIKYYDCIVKAQDKPIEGFDRIAKAGESPVPYMALFLNFDQNELTRKKAMDAYLMSASRETARKRYIYYVLSQAFRKE